MNFLPLLAERVLNRPLLIHPDKAAMIMSVLEGRITLGEIEGPKPEASRFIGSQHRQDLSVRLAHAHGSTALITVDGSLVNRGAYIGSQSGLVSYEGIGAQIRDAASDKSINSIVLDMNSFGGEATGMFGLAELIRSVGRKKRFVAVINDVAASAAYGLASAAHEIVVSPTSVVGSIGVVMMHLDRSAEMDAKGVRPTFIHAGAKKVDGHPFGPLPENVRADMQKDINLLMDLFLSTVAAGRGRRLTAAGARATEADVYFGRDAIKAGLADRIGNLDEVLLELKPATTKQRKGTTMHQDPEIASAIAADRLRSTAIISLPEAKGREGSALAFANAGLSIEAARTALATIPMAAAASGANVPPVGQRETGAEIGASTPQVAAPEVAKAGWSKAIADVNRRVG